MSEEISRLIDADLNPERRKQTLNTACSDPVVLKKWQRYHLIGHVIRGEVRVTGKDLSDQIADKISQEPTILTPAMLKPVEAEQRNTWQAAAMFAVAASLVLVAVVSLNPQDMQDRKQQIVSVESAGSATSDGEKFAQEFDEMLSEHGEFSGSAALNGLVSYAKLVSNQRLDH